MSLQTELERHITARQVALELGVSVQYVHRLMNDGRLPAIKTPLGWLIDPDDVLRLKEERQAQIAS